MEDRTKEMRRRGFGIVLVVAIGAGVLLPAWHDPSAVQATAEKATSEPSSQPARTEQTKPPAETVAPVMAPMRDGVRLAATCKLPEGPFPVVLARSVYGRSLSMAKTFNALGIAFVIQDTRGRGESEGEDRMFATDGWGELQDGADTVNWLLEQEWCNGKIATFGPSALTITQTLMAPATSNVACQALWVGTSRFYGYLSYQGGVWRKALCETWLDRVKSPHIIEVWKSHPAEDEFWDQYNAETHAEDVTAPAVHVGGWWDIFQQGTIDNFITRQHHGGEGARGNQQLIMGPWLHGPVPKPGDLTLRENFNYDFAKHTVRFVVHWLLGVDTGIMDEPPVRYYTLGDVEDPEAPGNEWRTAQDWPPFPTENVPYYLHADGTLSVFAPDTDNASLTYTYDPRNPCPTHGGANLTIPAGPFDQRTIGDREDVLKFATEPLTAPLEVTGRVAVRLYVASDAADTDFTAKLIDVYPDGREILMLDNIQRVKFRKGFRTAQPLPPGEIGQLDIDLWSISLIFNKGHRIGLHVSSSNYPRFEVNPNSGDDFPTEENMRTAKNTVFMDKSHPSALIVPLPASPEPEKQSGGLRSSGTSTRSRRGGRPTRGDHG